MGHASDGLHYRVQLLDLHAHLFAVELRVPRPAAGQVFSLPVWTPGSYLVREFAKNLQCLSARQDGQPCTLEQMGKDRWQARCRADVPLLLSWQFCAYDTSVRAAWLDARRGFFNGTSLLLRVHGQEHAPHALELVPPHQKPDWRVATALHARQVDARGWGLYAAADYDELVDCPVEMGHFWRGEFAVRGVPHAFVLTGAAPGLDGQRLVQDVQRICEEVCAFWHGPQQPPPMPGYVFLLNVLDEGYGGLEHRSSTALVCARRDLPQMRAGRESRPPKGYTTLLGLISHEYFHAWCVKRLRPRAFVRYWYDRENCTELLWFFEGFTSYYDDLLLRRTALVDEAQYLKLLARSLGQVLQTPGRQVQSVAQASRDAWIKYYRPDANTPNQTVSYYTKGAMVALCLDLLLRSEGRSTLDAVMRNLWQRCCAPGQDGGMGEDDLLAALESCGGRSFGAEIRAWVHGTQEPPWQSLLAAHGVRARHKPPQLSQSLGLRVRQDGRSSIVQSVLRASSAERAGLMAGDECLAVETRADDGAVQRWRMREVDDLLLYGGQAQDVLLWVARDQQILALPLSLAQAEGDGAGSVLLEITDREAAGRWLGAQSPP